MPKATKVRQEMPYKKVDAKAADLPRLLQDLYQHRRDDADKFVGLLLETVKTDADGQGLLAHEIVCRVGVTKPKAVASQIPILLASSSRRLQSVGVELIKTPAGRLVFGPALEESLDLIDRILAKAVGTGFQQNYSPARVLKALGGVGAWPDLNEEEAFALQKFWSQAMALPGQLKFDAKARAGLSGGEARHYLPDALKQTIIELRLLGAEDRFVHPLEQTHDKIGSWASARRCLELAQRWNTNGRGFLEGRKHRPDLDADLDEALRWSSQAVDICRKNPGREGPGGSAIEVWLAHGELSLAAGRSREAIESANQALALWIKYEQALGLMPRGCQGMLLLVRCYRFRDDRTRQMATARQLADGLRRAQSTTKGSESSIAIWMVRLGSETAASDPAFGHALEKEALQLLNGVGWQIASHEEMRKRLRMA